jgi:hypothetical protein
VNGWDFFWLRFSGYGPKSDDVFSDRRYESPLEGAFEWDFAKYVGRGVKITPQVECLTMLGTFRLDFLITGKLRVGIELDGEKFHDEWRDECRDAIILGEKHCDVIYRFKGKDIWHNTADMLYFMTKCDPWMFNDRIENLKTLSCRQQQEVDPDNETHLLFVSYFDDVPVEHFRSTLVFRRARASKYRQHWRHLYEFALERKPTSLEQMLKLKEEEWQEKIKA